MRRSTIAVLAATTLLCACDGVQDSECMSKGEIGTIVEITKSMSPGNYGRTMPMVLIRFRMQKYLKDRGSLRICEANDGDAIAMLRKGDTYRPLDMRDVTP